MTDRIEAWRELEARRVYRSRIFDVTERRMREDGPGGRTGDFVRIDPPDWVNVVALTEAGEVVLIEQWRHGVDRMTLEIPGGMVDPGESPAEAARRELAEETGFSAERWTLAGAIEPNPAIQSNRCITYLAEGARKTAEPRFDGNEACRLVLEPWSRIDALVAGGHVTHALVVVGIHFAKLHQAGHRFAGGENRADSRLTAG